MTRVFMIWFICSQTTGKSLAKIKLNGNGITCASKMPNLLASKINGFTLIYAMCGFYEFTVLCNAAAATCQDIPG